MADLRVRFMPGRREKIAFLVGATLAASSSLPWIFPQPASRVLEVLYLEQPLGVLGRVWLEVLSAASAGRLGPETVLSLRDYWLAYGALMRAAGIGKAFSTAASSWEAVLAVLGLAFFLWLWPLGFAGTCLAFRRALGLAARAVRVLNAERERLRLERLARRRASSFLARNPGARAEQALRWLERHALPFPASISHHQARTGGLFFHSLDVAEKALELAESHELNPQDREVLVCAALLHDVGKTRLLAYQGPTTRWEGEGGTRGFFRFLKKPDFGPRKWIRIGARGEDHARLGAEIAAREVFPPDEDRIFVSRVTHLVREHHSEDPGNSTVFRLLIEADRVMTGEEQNELKELVRENLRGVVRSFVPNLPVDGKVMLIWTPDLPDVLFVNSFYLRDKLLEYVREFGFTVPQRTLFKKVGTMDQVIWEVVEEEGWRKDLPGVSSRDRLVRVRLGKVEFKLLPLAVEKFFSKEEIERFPPYGYKIALVDGIKGEGENSRKEVQEAPVPDEDRVDLEALARLWLERFGSRAVPADGVASLAGELGCRLEGDARTTGLRVARLLQRLDGIVLDGSRLVLERKRQKGKMWYSLRLETALKAPRGIRVVKKQKQGT